MKKEIILKTVMLAFMAMLTMNMSEHTTRMNSYNNACSRTQSVMKCSQKCLSISSYGHPYPDIESISL